MNFLDRNEFNFEPSQKVVEAIKNFDPKTLCFYTRIYDQGKKSVVSVRLSEIYNVPEEQVLLAYGGEDILKNAIHYYLMKGDNKKILIPEFSWWYYNKVASECYGTFEMYPLHEQDDTFAYDVDEVIEYTNRLHPRMLLLASPNNPTGNSLTPEEIGRIMENIPGDTMVLIDEAYASFITSDTDYIAPLVNKYANLIISRTLSKFYGLPGLRCGFGFIGAGHDHFVSYINKYLGYNRFSEAVALAALDSDEHYRRVADCGQAGAPGPSRALPAGYRPAPVLPGPGGGHPGRHALPGRLYLRDGFPNGSGPQPLQHQRPFLMVFRILFVSL